MAYKTLENNKIHLGDALEVLKTFPDNQIDMCITSPPYWGLRDYGVDGQLGLEPNFNDYINRLCTIFDEVKRCLKDSGTCWVNIGDTYSSSHTGGHHSNKSTVGANTEGVQEFRQTKLRGQLPDKPLVGIPFRFALEMINNGWILRNTIIWYKPNCMPSSVKDRFTVDFEYLFFFTKNKNYYFEQQLEKTKKDSLKQYKYGLHTRVNDLVYPGDAKNSFHDIDKMEDSFNNPNFKNKRAVWTITTKPYKEAHFAVYPPELIETPIKAGCPQFICNECGKPRIKITESKIVKRKRLNEFTQPTKDRSLSPNSYVGKEVISESYSDCGCNAGFHQGIVLDPFIGSGTTAAVAKSLGRNYIGIELNPDYLDLIKNRVNETIRPLESID
jgi:site-specific DNA-methyltransferase (adenine-specific)